jgi:hypothetical protein
MAAPWWQRAQARGATALLHKAMRAATNEPSADFNFSSGYSDSSNHAFE